MDKPKSIIKEEELAVIKTFEDGVRKNFLAIRVVRWNDGDPVVEKRWFFRSPSGSLKTGRCTGFSLSDIILLAEKKDKIVALIERGEGIGSKL